MDAGKPVMAKEEVLTPFIKEVMEATLEGELDSHLNQEIATNRRNGKRMLLSVKLVISGN